MRKECTGEEDVGFKEGEEGKWGREEGKWRWVGCGNQKETRERKWGKGKVRCKKGNEKKPCERKNIHVHTEREVGEMEIIDSFTCCQKIMCERLKSRSGWKGVKIVMIAYTCIYYIFSPLIPVRK